MPSRRQLLGAAAALPLLMTGSSLFAAPDGFDATDFWQRPREVWLRRRFVGEEIRAVYWADGQIVWSGYQALSWILRDVRLERRIAGMRQAAAAAGQVPRIPAGWVPSVWVSLTLLDILYALGGWLRFFGMDRPVDLTNGSSAYRHVVTNDTTEGAAKDSRHMHAGAADLRIEGVPPGRIAEFGRWLKAGGVGFYPGELFTHVDDGALRFWQGRPKS